MIAGKAFRIADVRRMDGFTLRVRWLDNKTLDVNLRDPVFRLKGLRPLRDPKKFALASRGEGGHSVVWPGDLAKVHFNARATKALDNGHCYVSAYGALVQQTLGRDCAAIGRTPVTIAA